VTAAVLGFGPWHNQWGFRVGKKSSKNAKANKQRNAHNAAKRSKASKGTKKAFKAIIESMPELQQAKLMQFDDHGWPAGDAGVDMAKLLLSQWCAALNAKGWDQPNSVALVSRPDVSAADFAAMGIEVSDVVEMLTPEDLDQGPASVVNIHTDTFEEHPSEALWGQDIEPEVNALVIAMEAWMGGTDSDVRPSEDPERQEVRSFLLLTRSGLYMHAQYLRNDNELLFADNARAAMGVLMHRAMNVPVPADWPRFSLKTYIGINAAGNTGSVYRRILEQVGPDGCTVRGVEGSILISAMSYLWSVSRDGQLLLGKEKAKLSAMRNGKVDLMWNDEDRAKAIPLLRELFDRFTWVDYVSAPAIRETLEFDSLMWPFEPPTWASDDVLAAYAAQRPTPSPASKQLEGLPEKPKEAGLAMLGQLGLL